MKLLLSALLVAASTAACAQAQTAPAPKSETAATDSDQPTQQQIEALKARTVQALQEAVLTSDPQTSQTGCPVVLTQAHLNWPATFMPVTAAEKVTEPNLALGFQNPSGKAIRSVSITARFMGKSSKYQLDASAFEMRLMFSGSGSADSAAEELREIRLPQKMFVYGVTRIALDQVTFSDGTFWSAIGHSNCALNVTGSAERIDR